MTSSAASLGRAAPAVLGRLRENSKTHAPALLPGLLVVALMLVWAVHDGGYDTDTWYWGALVLLGLLSSVVIAHGIASLRLSRLLLIALSAFALYTAFSYLSIAWAGSPGDALDGANRTLLYLLVFALLAVLPWNARSALIALITLVIGVGVIAIVLLIRLASADHVARLVIAGRLSAPTGYFNATAALFTMNSLIAVLLCVRRELPAPLRGALVAFACAGLQLALIVQSRGWLFTLPLILIATIAVSGDRLRVVAASLFPAAAVLAPLHRLLGVFRSQAGAALDHASHRAGVISLVICGAMFLGATLVAWGETTLALPSLGAARRRTLGIAVTAVIAVGSCAGAVAATHGHPIRFVNRQWHGFTHPPSRSDVSSHFSSVGSGRYDFWRVSLDAFVAHPLGGLGQDNFADYYIRVRRTSEEPRWTHSLEMRLLAHTGIVGFGLFAVFIVASLRSALAGLRRSAGLPRTVAGAALVPVIVWLVHGSVDWFWELPALSGPALGFLAVAGALGTAGSARPVSVRRRLPSILLPIGGLGLVIAAVIALGFPYLSVREVSVATSVRPHDAARALHDLSRAASINPLSADPGRTGGVVALQVGQWKDAERRFRQAISREPGGWFAWLGAGLAASAQGDAARAAHYFQVAASLNKQDAVIRLARARVYTSSPLPPLEALQMVFAT